MVGAEDGNINNNHSGIIIRKGGNLFYFPSQIILSGTELCDPWEEEEDVVVNSGDL